MSYDYFEDGDELNFRWLKRAWEWTRSKWLELFATVFLLAVVALLVFGIIDAARINASNHAKLRRCEAGDMAVCAECADTVEACRSHLRAYFYKEKGE